MVLLVYLAFALPLTASMARQELIKDAHISVADSMHTGFITSDDISRELALDKLLGAPRCSVSIAEIESALLASDKIERANVALLNNGSMAIDVVPMTPVARVFDSRTRGSYYINASGKRIGAEARYHVDVPVVCGHFSEQYPPTRLLPLLSLIAADPQLDAMVSTVVSEADGDIILVPALRGHVVNFGDTTYLADKFRRLRLFYRTVSPVRGWDSYDTISVKWAGQIVATRRSGHLEPVQLAVAEKEFIDAADTETAEGIDPESILPDDAYAPRQ